jgi:hypothetical protein
LCDFLGLPVPDVPFPHINDRIRIAAVVMVLKAITWIWPLALVIPLVVLKQIVSRQKRAKKIKMD